MDILSLEIEPKYKKWLKGIIKDGDIHPSLVYMCQKHSRLIEKIPIEFRDIFNFKSVDDFVSYVDTIESETNIEETIKKNGSKIIYEDENYLIRRITTADAMTVYGRGSKWCISTEDGKTWNNYINKGYIFFIVFSKNIPYNSQFNKFVVSVNQEGLLSIWDRADICYHSNILDIIKLDSKIFKGEFDSKLVNNLLEYINDDDVINILKETNAIVAGGVFTSIIRNEKINDIDIWFLSEADFLKGVEMFKKIHKPRKGIDIFGNIEFTEYRPSYESKYSFTFTINTKTYQLIKPRYVFSDVKGLISCFDFKCVMCGFSFKTNMVNYHDDFIKEAKYGSITINPTLKSPGNLLRRIIKYTKKGFRVSNQTIKDSLLILSNLTEEEIKEASLY